MTATRTTNLAVLRGMAAMALGLGMAAAQAVPTLQVGAPAAPGGSCAGPYAPYTASTTNPTESDTAITLGNKLCVGGVYGPNDVLVGGKYSTGVDWSGTSGWTWGTGFDGHGAVLMASVAQGTLGSGTITVNGVSAFLTALTSPFPNNHDPAKDATADFLFFDIGNFLNSLNAVPDFATGTGSANGQIKSLTIAVSGFEWVHFDVMALVTSEKGTKVVTTVDGNPGSHDVTWKKDGGGGGQQEVPEPTSLLLAGLGLLAAGSVRRRRA